jgi:hypothetical protein
MPIGVTVWSDYDNGLKGLGPKCTARYRAGRNALQAMLMAGIIYVPDTWCQDWWTTLWAAEE